MKTVGGDAKPEALQLGVQKAKKIEAEGSKGRWNSWGGPALPVLSSQAGFGAVSSPAASGVRGRTRDGHGSGRPAGRVGSGRGSESRQIWRVGSGRVEISEMHYFFSLSVDLSKFSYCS